MKRYYGKKRIAKKNSFRTSNYENQVCEYLLNAKPGDLISGCTSFLNLKIDKIEFIYSNDNSNGRSKNKSRYLSEIVVHTDNGFVHYWPGGGCVSLPKTSSEEVCVEIKETMNYYKEFGETPNEKVQQIFNAVNDGSIKFNNDFTEIIF